MIKVASINNATAEDVSRKYQGWTHTAYVSSFIQFPFILFDWCSHYQGQAAQDCQVFYASDYDGHYCEARLLSRPPAPDYWVLTQAGTLKDSNQRPAANLRCRLLDLLTTPSTKTNHLHQIISDERGTRTLHRMYSAAPPGAASWLHLLLLGN